VSAALLWLAHAPLQCLPTTPTVCECLTLLLIRCAAGFGLQLAPFDRAVKGNSVLVLPPSCRHRPNDALRTGIHECVIRGALDVSGDVGWDCPRCNLIWPCFASLICVLLLCLPPKQDVQMDEAGQQVEGTAPVQQADAAAVADGAGVASLAAATTEQGVCF